MIKPIETVYNGYRFRSRLEARWAVFFDTMGIEYQYEPEGFELGNGVKYLPDFYLPQQEIWIEIKSGFPDIDEQRKAMELYLALNDKLIKATGNPRHLKEFVHIGCGTPWFPKFKIDSDGFNLLDGYIVLTPDVFADCWHIGAFRGDKESWDIWPLYVTEEFSGMFDARRCGLLEAGPYYYSLQLPLSYMHRIYIGSGVDYATDDLARAYKAARQARFEHGERPGA